MTEEINGKNAIKSILLRYIKFKHFTTDSPITILKPYKTTKRGKRFYEEPHSNYSSRKKEDEL